MSFPAIQRVWRPWQTWECYRSGFFSPTGDRGELERWRDGYRRLLTDIPAFHTAMDRVLTEWPNSAVHNLTNDSMNRIAWLGQSACCITYGACAEQTRSAFSTLPEDDQGEANAAAAYVLFEWLRLSKMFRSIAE